MEQKRGFISIYFKDAVKQNRKRRDVTIAFDEDDPLYKICKKMGSTGIKEVIGIFSYVELLNEAANDNRTVGNYIKHKLRLNLNSPDKR